MILRFLFSLLLVFALLIGVDELVSTETGLLWSLRLFSSSLGGQLQIQQLHGDLHGPINVHGLHYHSHDLDLTIDTLDLSWQPLALLQGKLVFNYLHLSGITWRRLSANAQTTFTTTNLSLLERITINDLQLHALQVQPNQLTINVTGRLATNCNLHWQLSAPSFVGIGTLQGVATMPTLDATIKSLRIAQASFTLPPLTTQLHSEFNLQGFNLQLKTQTDKGQKLNGTLLLPGIEHLAILMPQQILNGKFQLFLPEINPFLPENLPIKNVRGYVQAIINLAGTLQSPHLTGVAKLLDASFTIPQLGMQLQDVRLTATGDQQQGINWVGSAQTSPTTTFSQYAKSPSGQLQLTGNTQLGSEPISMFNLQGKNILINSQNDQITLNPTLNIKLANEQLNISGKIIAPQAIFKSADQPSTLGLSSDVVFVNHNTAHKVPPLAATFAVTSELQFMLGNNVQVSYDGLTAKLQGDLQLNTAPKHPMTAEGQLYLVDGTYEYYGQKLTLSNTSSVTYSGGLLTNPTLDIQASRTVTALPQTNTLRSNNIIATTQNSLNSTATLLNQPTKVVVGIDARGDAQDPQFSLYAEPAILTQTDILAYLLTGQPSNQLGLANTQLLFTAANGLNPGQGKLQALVGDIQKATGLDELAVQPTSLINPTTNTIVQNTSLVLGKKLSPRLSVNYSIGLLQPLNILQLNYLLSKHWSLQSTTDNFANGIDLLYTIERK